MLYRTAAGVGRGRNSVHATKGDTQAHVATVDMEVKGKASKGGTLK